MIRSKGWNKTVEQNPEKEPERKDLTTGWLEILGGSEREQGRMYSIVHDITVASRLKKLENGDSASGILHKRL